MDLESVCMARQTWRGTGGCRMGLEMVWKKVSFVEGA